MVGKVAMAVGRALIPLLLPGAVGPACSGRGSHAAEKKAPVECQQYEAALDRCFQRDSGFASQPSVIPSSDAERIRIGKACAENLQRLPASCR